MPTQLKRAQRSIEELRGKGELAPEIDEALQEILNAIRAIEQRLAVLETNSR